jgi:peptidoglycan/xylan/chitin deacetylase (PgdA/CDA1 family)
LTKTVPSPEMLDVDRPTLLEEPPLDVVPALELGGVVGVVLELPQAPTRRPTATMRVARFIIWRLPSFGTFVFMSFPELERRRQARQLARKARLRRRRITAGALLVAVVAIAAGAVAATSGGRGPVSRHRARRRLIAGHPLSTKRNQGGHGGLLSTVTSQQGTGKPGHAVAPILMYHVINPPLPTAPYPGLYVPAPEFAAQMQALKRAGWHAVTMDQLEANWTRGVPLGPGKPVVISFDNGYRSQYTNALPVLRALHWVGVENMQLQGLPPSQGGLTNGQVRGLIAAGWELDTQGISHADLITLDAAELHYQVATARQMLRRRYGAPVNWFCYPSGHYNATVISAVRAAGFTGSTTVVPGWAERSDDPYRLPRLRVLGGTTPSELLAEIAAAKAASPVPPSYS